MRRGHTIVELDEAGKINRLTAICGSGLLSCAPCVLILMRDYG